MTRENMTREEAIENLKELLDSNYVDSFEDAENEALRMGIRALEQEPCGDCVNRQAVFEQIDQWAIGNREYLYTNAMHYLTKRIQDIPPVTPLPKTGHWVEENINEWSRKVFCSECGCPPPFEHISNGDVYSASGYGVTNKTKYCPNCGARMEREG